MKTKTIGLATAALFIQFFFSGLAGQVWSLDDCLRYACEQHESVKIAALGVEEQRASKRRQELSLYPQLSLISSGGIQFGKSIDPTTNTFNDHRTGFGGLEVQFSWVLFRGGRGRNAIKKGALLLQSARAQKAQAVWELKMHVLRSYLNILVGEEQRIYSKANLDVSEQQLRQLEELVNNGVRPEGDKLELLNQLTENRQRVIEAEQTLALAKQQLKFWLGLSPEKAIEIDESGIDNTAALDSELISRPSLESHPSQEMAALQVMVAESEVAVSKGLRFPTVALVGGLFTNYSSAAHEVNNFDTKMVRQQVTIMGNQMTMEAPLTIPHYRTPSLASQFWKNFGQQIGIRVTVPILQNGNTKWSQEKAEINLQNRKLASKQNRRQLQKELAQLTIGTRTAKSIYDLARQRLSVAQRAFQKIQDEYHLGITTAMDLVITGNQLLRAQRNYIEAKYTFLFKLKTLELY